MSPNRSPGPEKSSEIAKFNTLAHDWWDENGAMAPLHRMNPVRLSHVIQQLSSKFGSLKGLEILDVGCGGGLVAEPLARLGAKVTGLDGAAELIQVANDHAASQNLSITYIHGQTPDLLQKKKKYDVVLALEVIEHVDDVDQFVGDIAALTKPDGLAIFSTLNRTPASFAFGIVAAEYVLHWLPAGTHNWRKFVKPSELHDLCVAHNLDPQNTTGMVWSPTKNEFRIDARKLGVNYFLSAVKK